MEKIADDLVQYEEVSRTMLSPLAAGSVEGWRGEVNGAIGRLFGADATISLLPKGEHLFFSEERPHIAAAVESYTKAYTAEGLFVRDVVVDVWPVIPRGPGQPWSGNFTPSKVCTDP